jgi:hypothetical protein
VGVGQIVDPARGRQPLGELCCRELNCHGRDGTGR